RTHPHPRISGTGNSRASPQGGGGIVLLRGGRRAADGCSGLKSPLAISTALRSLAATPLRLAGDDNVVLSPTREGVGAEEGEQGFAAGVGAFDLQQMAGFGNRLIFVAAFERQRAV